MPFTFNQGSGIYVSPEGRNLFTGYSGHGPGRCNPALQHIRNVGPLPQGLYRISAAFECTRDLSPASTCEQCGGVGRHKHGPDVLRLLPVSPPVNPRYTDEQVALIAQLATAKDPQPWMFGRSGMLDHGDSLSHDASEGCMINDHATRVFTQRHADKFLNVIS